MAAQTCHMCDRPLSVCRERVDHRFPARAREAYARADLVDAATCPQGQAADLRATGWCWDRARFDRYWTGAAMSEAERRGAGIALEPRP